MRQSVNQYFLSIILLTLFLSTPSFSQGNFVVGKDYEVLPQGSAGPAQFFHNNKTSKGSIPVLEFFSYGCSWCYYIEPYLTTWAKQQENNISLTRIPVIFRPEWQLYAKAYYAAQRLHLETTLHPLLFKTIQEKKTSLAHPETMSRFFIEQHCDPTVIKNMFENPEAFKTILTAGVTSMASFRIQSVPTIIINDQYKVNLSMAENPARLIQILDFLVELSQKNQSETKNTMKAA